MPEKAEKEIRICRVTQEDLDELCKRAVRIATDYLEKEFYCKDTYTKPYNPITILLENYMIMRSSLSMSDSDICQTDEEYECVCTLIRALSTTKNREDFIRTIKGSADCSRLVIKCLNTALAIWKVECYASSFKLNRRKYKVLECKYLQGKRFVAINTIAKKYSLHPSTVEHDIDEALTDLGFKILGLPLYNIY